jgi:hypothetical protein
MPAKWDKSGLTKQYPWIVAFAFGLLHCFGFAGALAQIGSAQTAIPMALLFFRCGVEVGQLLFVGAALAVSGLLPRLTKDLALWKAKRVSVIPA